jgi:L-rhamnose mutarotase
MKMRVQGSGFGVQGKADRTGLGVEDLELSASRSQRFGRCAQLRPGAEAEYDRLHAAVWPEVLAAIQRAGIRNYSIFRHGRWLFSYFEIPVEVDFDEAIGIMLDDPACRRWETVVRTLQESSVAETSGVAWMPMKEVFHLP